MSTPPSVEAMKEMRGGAIDQCGEIELARDRRAVLDEQPLDHATRRPRLQRHQRLAQHLPGKRLHLVDRLGEPHAALVAGLGLFEFALAAAPGMDLRLHHPHRPGQPLGGPHRLIHRERGRALRQRHPVLPQQLLGLVFVDVHAGPVDREFANALLTTSRQPSIWHTVCQMLFLCQCALSSLRDGYIALREAIISISTLAPIGRAATATVERAG